MLLIKLDIRIVNCILFLWVLSVGNSEPNRYRNPSESENHVEPLTPGG